MGAKSIDDFIAKMGNRCNKLVREGNILYSIKTEGCDCGWVRATKTPVSSTFCLCAKGYIKKYFEAVFQRPVKVELLKSAVCGDEVCKFAIYLDS
jgi:predicted hydrocarbon binding protein